METLEETYFFHRHKLLQTSHITCCDLQLHVVKKRKVHARVSQFSWRLNNERTIHFGKYLVNIQGPIPFRVPLPFQKTHDKRKQQKNKLPSDENSPNFAKRNKEIQNSDGYVHYGQPVRLHLRQEHTHFNCLNLKSMCNVCGK